MKTEENELISFIETRLSLDETALLGNVHVVLENLAFFARFLSLNVLNGQRMYMEHLIQHISVRISLNKLSL